MVIEWNLIKTETFFEVMKEGEKTWKCIQQEII